MNRLAQMRTHNTTLPRRSLIVVVGPFMSMQSFAPIEISLWYYVWSLTM
jgi:hypothetical protein